MARAFPRTVQASISEVETARRIVLAHGWNATAFQIVNPGFELWFNEARTAVVGSMVSRHVRVVAGAPVCDDAALPHIVSQFERNTIAKGERPCYFGAADRMFQHVSGRPEYSMAVMGAQPVWSPRQWVSRTHSDRSLRAQFHRAANKGVHIKEWPPDRASEHSELRRVLSEWLATRGLPPLHFLIEPETLQRLEGRRVFVALRDRKPVGFTVLSPIPRRIGWLSEQFVRGRDAPNGTVELMIDGALQAVASEGAEYFTMGLVPLSHLAAPIAGREPFWMSTLLRWVRGHGRKFYNFEGLERFKEKFHPTDWERIYVVSREPKFSFRTLWAVASVFAGGSPARAVWRGATKRRNAS